MWHKFNDRKVNIVPEEDVFSDANGGSARAAYWVVYINSEKFADNMKLKINSFDSSNDQTNLENHPYAKMIEESILAPIIVENDQMSQELNDLLAKEDP